RGCLAGSVWSEVAKDVAALDRQVDVVDGDDVAVALDEPARLDRRCIAHFTARAAVSAAEAGSEPASTKLVPPVCQVSTVPSWVASSCAVRPSSDTVGRLESMPLALVEESAFVEESALRSTSA